MTLYANEKFGFKLNLGELMCSYMFLVKINYVWYVSCTIFYDLLV